MGTAAKAPQTPDNWDPNLLTDTVAFRGVTYSLRELGLNEFNAIQEKAKVTETRTIDGEEQEISYVSADIQSRLMVEACVHPQPTKPVGMRLFNGLWAKVRTLNFGEEPETNKVDDKETEDDASEESEGKKGN